MAEASCTKRTGTPCTHTAKTRTALHMQGLLRIGQVKHLGNSYAQSVIIISIITIKRQGEPYRSILQDSQCTVYPMIHIPHHRCCQGFRMFVFVIYLLAMLALRCGQGGLSLAAAGWLPLLPNRSLRAQVYSTAVAHRLSCPTACGVLLPQPGINLCSLHQKVSSPLNHTEVLCMFIKKALMNSLKSHLTAKLYLIQ